MAVFLVTGGAGFIGSNIVKALIKKGEKVKVIDNFLTGRKENISELLDEIEFIDCDIKDFESVRGAVKGVDFVLHQAALCSVPRSIKDPLATNCNNVDGTLNVLIASKEAGVKKFVFASSSSIYGDTKVLPKTEEVTPNPASPYAVSKLAGEFYCKVFYKNYGLETVILRYFNVFGENQNPESEYAAVIPKFVNSLLKDQPPVIFGDGEQTRDFTYIDNVVQANLKACCAPDEACGELFNVAYGKTQSVNVLFAKIKSLLNKNIEPVYEKFREGEVKQSWADVNKAKKILGYNPQVDLDNGLASTVEYYKKYFRNNRKESQEY